MPKRPTSPASSYHSAAPTIPPIGKWTASKPDANAYQFRRIAFTEAAKAAHRSSKATIVPHKIRLLANIRSQQQAFDEPGPRPSSHPTHSLPASCFGSAFHRGSPGRSAVCSRASSFRFQRLVQGRRR
ncbi:hypothetical protein ROHU_016254 [Labeo rohita]|uniref:Uncharacterized protein n=1 Tax=Labeo rohita TaxID=84645 RepID=A0A498NKX2_LABRO|nr:hypothetical protein ROHU_016254 [Labeo rohita]